MVTVTSKVLHKPDTGTADRFAVVATIANETKLWGTTTAAADPESLLRGFVRAFPAVDFSPTSGNRLRVMRWADWKRAEAGEPARGLDDVDDVERDAPAATGHAELVAGLMELAQFLHDHPELPAPPYPTLQHIVLADDDVAGVAQVEQIAALLGADVDMVGHPGTCRQFAGLRYRAYYVRETARRYAAFSTYDGVVEPDGSES